MNNNDNLRYLNQVKDNIILKIQFLTYILNNHKLAFARIRDAKKFVIAENQRVINNPDNSKDLKAFLYVYHPALYSSLTYLGYDDFLNFNVGKAEIIIENEENRNMMVVNYDFALNSWEDARKRIEQSSKHISEYIKVLNEELLDINNKISNILYNNDEILDVENSPTTLKKMPANEYDQISEWYLKSCEKLNLISPSPYKIRKLYPNSLSKNKWYVILADPGFLFYIKKKLDKKIEDKRVKKSEINLLVNVRENIHLLMQKAADKMNRNKEKPLDERIEFYDNTFEYSSQQLQNSSAIWDKE